MITLKHPDALRIDAAAQRLEEMAAGFGAEEFWQRDTRAPYGWSEAAQVWAREMGPRIAKPIVAWLRSEARTLELDWIGSGGTPVAHEYVASRYAPALEFAAMLAPVPSPSLPKEGEGSGE